MKGREEILLESPQKTIAAAESDSAEYNTTYSRCHSTMEYDCTVVFQFFYLRVYENYCGT